MTLSFPIFNLANLKWRFRAPFEKPANTAQSESDNASADREFLREVMARNPEAIQNELGLMAMMSQYPRHF